MKRIAPLLFIMLWVPCSWAVSSIITTNASTCPVKTNATALIVALPQDKGGATLTIAGTWTGTISFKGSGDGGATWTAVNVMPLGSTTAVTSATANGTWQVNTAGFTGICMLASAAVTGSAVATVTPSAAPFAKGGSGSGGGDTVTSPNSTITVGGTSTNTTVDVTGAAGEILAGATPALTYSPTLGAVGHQGSVNIAGTTSGTLAITTQAAAGTPTWTAGTSSGTPVVTASSPLAITTATGNATCATCATGPGSSTANHLAKFSDTGGLALADAAAFAATSTASAVVQANASGLIDSTFITPLTYFTLFNSPPTSVTFAGSADVIRGTQFTLAQPVTFSNINISINTTDAANPVYGAAIVDVGAANGGFGTSGAARCHNTSGVQLTANSTMTAFPCSEGAVTLLPGNYAMLTTAHIATGKYNGSLAYLTYWSSAGVGGCTASNGVITFSTPCTISYAISAAGVFPATILH